MKLKLLIILICIYGCLFSQNTNCTPQVEPMPSPALHLPRLVWQSQTATTLNVQKSQNNVNDWTSGATVNRPIAEGESVTFRSNNGIKAVGLGRGLRSEASLIWRQPHSISYGFYINRWSGTAYPMESQGSAATRIDYESEGRPWNDNSVFKIKRVCNKVYYYMDDIQFPHVSTIINPGDLFYFDMNFKDALGWVYDVTIYGACGTPDCTNGSITPTFTQIDPICAGGTFTLPTTSNNVVTGTWSPSINNQATTTYTFTPNAGQSASNTTMTVTVNNPATPTFTQISPICRGGTFTLPTTSNNGITGSWSPAVNNQATTEYTFTPSSGQCAGNTTMTVTVNNATVPAFTQVPPICAGDSFSLPTTSDNGIAGTWSPAVNNQATTEYTFTPNPGQCASTTTMTVTVNPSVSLVLSSGSNNQTVDINTPISSIVYTFGNGAIGATVTGLPSGVNAIVNGTSITISGTPTVSGNFNYTVSTNGGCGITTLQGNIIVSAARDWRLAPNSFIFTGKDNNGSDADGLYIPVKKAYEMWRNGGTYMSNSQSDPTYPQIPSGSVTADVLWEDTHGLIKSGTAYSLEIIGTGENAKIKVPINKAIEGNAVITLKVNGEIYWSWHVWVTDDPTNGSTYKSFDNLKRERSNGTVELIPDSDWGWMDRNLGALGSSITGSDQYDKNGGLLYQWGRKDPIPTLITRGNNYYEVSGSIGRVRHSSSSQDFTTTYTPFNDLRIFVPQQEATVWNNLKLSIKKPLSLIYSNATYTYNGVNKGSYNWFGDIGSLYYANNSRVNFWSDNSKGERVGAITDAQSYKTKAYYDPCPNGWRIPSMLTAWYGTSGLPLNFSPFGPKTSTPAQSFYNSASTLQLGSSPTYYGILKPNYNNFSSYPSYLKSVKVYSNLGVDMTNFSGSNLGVFPGTGKITQSEHSGTYNDMHQVRIWTATMPKIGGGTTTPYDPGTASNQARGLIILPENETTEKPDTNLPNVTGRYSYQAEFAFSTSDVNACRCIKDPLYKVNQYDFPTDFFTEQKNYTEGLDQPNSYQKVRSTTAFTIEIPVSKAIAMQNQYMNNTEILSTNSYNNLKANVYWSTNPQLINSISVANASPSSLQSLSNSKILVEVNPNQTGNAVVTLHNGSVDNPIYWSWHIWITDTEVSSYVYTTDVGDPAAPNFVNYVKGLKSVAVKQTEFMDRDLGAMNELPVLQTADAPTTNELLQIQNAAGLHYQWGRKDPFPAFHENVNNNAYDIFLGKANANGSITYNPLTASTFETVGGSYIIPYNTYTNSSNANILSTDKTVDKIAKVLSYSAKNPLVFMIPSQRNPFNGVQTMGTDWLINQPNLFSDRWGKGTVKSPFDPCPEGWRIPDTDASIDGDNLGGSPWYKKNVIVGEKNALTDYLAAPIKSGTVTLGYAFQNPAYKIGNYGRSGIRGDRGVWSSNSSLINTNVQFNENKWWTASVRSHYQGRPISFYLNMSNNKMILPNNDNDQYFGAACRCVKIKYDGNGKEQGFYPDAIAVPQNTEGKATDILDIEQIVKKDKLMVFPNPVKNLLYIDTNDSKEYYYQIYNMAGQMVEEGKFNNKQTDISKLPAGNYLIRINNSESVVKIIKQ